MLLPVLENLCERFTRVLGQVGRERDTPARKLQGIENEILVSLLCRHFWPPPILSEVGLHEDLALLISIDALLKVTGISGKTSCFDVTHFVSLLNWNWDLHWVQRLQDL